MDTGLVRNIELLDIEFNFMPGRRGVEFGAPFQVAHRRVNAVTVPRQKNCDLQPDTGGRACN
jgi:hypothetical protein